MVSDAQKWLTMIPSQNDLKSVLSYDPITGLFSWVKDIRAGRNNAFLLAAAGSLAGNLGTYGYWYLSFGGKRLPAHRCAFLYVNGEYPAKGLDVDHINGVRTDNSFVNLRLVTRSQNMQNLKGAHKDNSTGLLGVMRHRDKFQARIMKDGKKTYLGDFETAEAAHLAYLVAKREIHEMGTL